MRVYHIGSDRAHDVAHLVATREVAEFLDIRTLGRSGRGQVVHVNAHYVAIAERDDVHFMAASHKVAAPFFGMRAIGRREKANTHRQS